MENKTLPEGQDLLKRLGYVKSFLESTNNEANKYFQIKQNYNDNVSRINNNRQITYNQLYGLPYKFGAFTTGVGISIAFIFITQKLAKFWWLNLGIGKFCIVTLIVLLIGHYLQITKAVWGATIFNIIMMLKWFEEMFYALCYSFMKTDKLYATKSFQYGYISTNILGLLV
ncbi:MAG: hypothetical protein Q3960_02015 [Lactobacillus sp.]|nr:hypothetical protein [Lactobacillus sp.]